MKKVIFKLWLIAALAFATVACTQDDGPMPPPADESPEQQSIATSRTEYEAIEHAIRDRQNMLGISTPESRAELEVRYVTDSRKSRSGGADTLFYVVNFPNEEGYAVIPKDNRLATLAVTESGSFTTIDEMENPGAKAYMEAAVSYASSIGTITPVKPPVDPGDPSPFPYLQFDTLEYINIPARINLRWGQSGTTAKYATNNAPKYPYRVSGCVPLACALTLSYFEQPKSIAINFPNAPVSSIGLNWRDIKGHVKEFDPYKSNKCYCSSSVAAHEQLSLLTRQLGYMCNANYIVYEDCAATGATLPAAYNTLKKLLPSQPIEYRYATNNIASDIQTGILVMLGTDKLSNDIHNSHCWICDGYYYVKYEENEYQVYNGIENAETGEKLKVFLRTLNTITIQYLHINWGWDGKNNGFYDYGVYDTSRIIKEDNPEDGRITGRYVYDVVNYIHVKI